ncbi:MAG TPA: histidinol-phosphate transaminase [Gemmatimonadales bacterium]|nr:histidinol-phosphate transaminase [Gemmatimonadales bacterium]
MTAAMTRREWVTSCSMTAAGLMLARPGVRELGALAPVAGPKPAKVIRLCFNENPHGPPATAIRAAQQALAGANRYADAEDFDALAARIAEREGVTPAHVLLGSGSSELLGLAAMAHARHGAEVVVAEPSFPHLGNIAEGLGATVRRVPVDAQYRHDLDRMAEAVTAATSLVQVCNPNNPTGTIVAGDQLRAFCERVSPRAPVLVDEAYHELVEAPAHATMVPLVNAGASVIVLRTFSKIYGMAGFRVGYAIARPDLIQQLKRLQTTDLSVPSLHAALAAYGDGTFTARSRRLIRDARELTARGLEELGVRYVPSHTNFIAFWAGPAQRDLPVRLYARGIKISWEVKPLAGDWARVSIGTTKEMHSFLQALRQEWHTA